MSCLTLSKGRKLACKTGTGGLKAVSFAVWSNATIMTSTNGEIATIPSGITSFYRYELKNTGNQYTEEIVSDEETRNTNYNGTLALVLQKLDLDTRNEVKMLAMGEVVVMLEDNNGNVFVIGNGNGANLTGGSFVTGGARSDMNGSNLTFTTSENEPYLRLASGTIAAYKAKVVEGL